MTNGIRSTRCGALGALGGSLFLILPVVSPHAQQVTQADPFIGTWKLNPAKSTYNGQQPWRSGIVTIERSERGLLLTNDFINGNGRGTKDTALLIYDGQPHAIRDNPNFDALVAKRIDPMSQEFTILKDGKVLRTERIVISADGKIATFTANGVNGSGQTLTRAQVYEKQ